MRAMKTLVFPAWLRFGLPLLALFVAGCSAISMDRLRPRGFYEQFAYTQDTVTSMKAAREVLEEMDYVLDFGSESSGRLEMVTRPLPGGTAQMRQQQRAVVTVEWTSEGTSMVRIGFWDEREDPEASTSMPSGGRLIRGGPAYDTFWERLDVRLPPDSALLPEEETPAK